MRALIFGGTGMLGRAVSAAVRKRGAPALALSRGQADITDRERLLYWVDTFRPDTIFNCAAFARVDACEGERERAFAVNSEAVANVVAAADRAGAPLVHVSTDYVFDGLGTEPYDEEAETAPLSVYGESKLGGERLAGEYDRGLAVRASWLFGPGGPNFARTMMSLIDRGDRELRVVADQAGCPTYTPFFAGALVDLAARIPGEARGVLHYRNQEPTTWHGFAAAIARRRNPSVEVVAVKTEEFPRPAPRPAYSVLDVSRFESLTGREVESWRWGLAEYIRQIDRGR